MAAVSHLGFVGGGRGTTHEGPIVVAIPRKNFVMISMAVLKLLVFEFLSFTLESPIHGSKMSVFWGLTAKI